MIEGSSDGLLTTVSTPLASSSLITLLSLVFLIFAFARRYDRLCFRITFIDGWISIAAMDNIAIELFIRQRRRRTLGMRNRFYIVRLLDRGSVDFLVTITIRLGYRRWIIIHFDLSLYFARDDLMLGRRVLESCCLVLMRRQAPSCVPGPGLNCRRAEPKSMLLSGVSSIERYHKHGRIISEPVRVCRSERMKGSRIVRAQSFGAKNIAKMALL